ncbi:hypothetical protein C8R43DRAFT_1125215 [Mycena crocata]|nr:hypothetical protein C8R43DRAFT_1125215 [Mycena crocata]
MTAATVCIPACAITPQPPTSAAPPGLPPPPHPSGGNGAAPSIVAASTPPLGRGAPPPPHYRCRGHFRRGPPALLESIQGNGVHSLLAGRRGDHDADYSSSGGRRVRNGMGGVPRGAA